MMLFGVLFYIQLYFSAILAAPAVENSAISERDNIGTFSRKWQNNCQDKGYSDLEVFCAENGPDGLAPQPDQKFNGPWDGAYCKRNDDTWAVSYRLERWWWDAPRYYTVICPKAWEQRNTLANVSQKIVDVGGKDKISMSFLFNELRAGTWLHEFTHHNLVTNPSPPVTDVLIRGRYGGIGGTYDTCYGPECAAVLAMYYKATTSVSDSDGGYNGEFGTAINADNYVSFALSVYFQETLSRQAPYEPEDPEWREVTKWKVAPVPNHPSSLDDPGSLNTGDVYDSGLSETISELNIVPVNVFTSIKDQALCINESTPDPFQQPFAESDALDTINAFCSNTRTLGFQMVPPISWGTGKTPTGQQKAMNFDNRLSSDDPTVKNGIWLNVRFCDEECGGAKPFAPGTNTADQTAYCVNNFRRIHDNCQPNSATAKYGGVLQTDCLYYQIQGRTANTTNNYIMKQTGPLNCKETDATLLPALAGTCRCSYAYYSAADTFNMPSSGSCIDVDPYKDLHTP